jgi:replicative DNA helicase
MNYEKLLIGCLIVDPSCVVRVASIVQPTDFRDKMNAYIYMQILKTTKEGNPVDIVVLSDDTNIDSAYLVELATQVNSVSGAVQYATKIKEESIRQRVKVSAEEVIDFCDKEEDIKTLISKSKQKFYSINGLKKRKTNQQHIQELLADRFEGKLKGIPIGIKELDEKIDGYKGGEVWVIGGYSSSGKTSFALQLVMRLQTVPVWYFSLEMPVKSIQNRLLHFYELEGWETGEAADLVAYKNLTIFDDKRTVDEIKMEYLFAENKPKVIFIDYIGIINNEGKSEYERITNITRELQEFALENDVCIVELSQINEESQKSNLKTYGFKGSGSIGNDADIAIKVIQEDTEGVDIIPFIVKLLKQRNGRKADFSFEFDKKLYKFIF